MDTQVLQLIRGMSHRQKPVFLLVQDDVLGVAKQPTKLPYCDLDLSQAWRIVVGTTSKSGKPKIVGTAAEAFPDDTSVKTCWRISSPIDGTDRLVGGVGTMAGLIHNRIGVLFGNGCYSDLSRLPPIITVFSCDPFQ